MITCKLWARLANQYFMAAATIAHAKRMETNWAMPVKTSSSYHSPYYFHWMPQTKQKTKHLYKEISHAYAPIPEYDDLTLEGYFQCELFFENAKPEVREALRFETQPLDTVAIHVRRGDYLLYPEQFPFIGEQYYHDAIDLLLTKGYDSYKIYSDDIDWCIQFFAGRMGIHAQYSRGKPMDDIKEIYNSAAIVTANSTFSLFPALLREDNPLVISPREDRWFGPKAGIDTSTLLPQRIVQI